MPQYEVEYQIESLDGDGPQTETAQFEVGSDESAREEARRILSRRVEEIKRKGSLANTGTYTVYRLRVTREQL